MSRMEPRIGSFGLDVAADPQVQAPRNATARKSGTSGQFLRGFVLTAGLLAIVLGALFALGKFGDGPLTRTLLGRLLAMSGLAMSVLVQVLACLVLLRHRVVDALASFVLPGYLFFALRRAGHHAWLFGVYFAAIASLAAGTLLLT